MFLDSNACCFFFVTFICSYPTSSIFAYIQLFDSTFIFLYVPLSFRYKEVCKPGYPFDGSVKRGTGHFTQIVWKESTEFGIGRATGKSKEGKFCTYIVGRYRPPGNFRGRYKTNVPKGNFTKDVCDKLSEMMKAVSGGGNFFEICASHTNFLS